MKWQIRLFRNALFGVLPLSTQQKLREIKRALVYHEMPLDLWTMRQGFRQVEMLRLSGCELSSKTFLEVGTGWSPVIPLIFALAGCKQLTLVDRQRLIGNVVMAQTSAQLLMHKEEISDRLRIPSVTIQQRLNRLRTMSLDEALAEINCRYLAPYDLLANDLQDHSQDLITSRAVLEHIPPITIRRMLTEFNRLLSTGGLMCHIIDNSDHWEHNDKSIPRLNFLRYSPTTFNLISSLNALDYQNRLRHSEYKKLIEEAGFQVVLDDSPPDKKALSELALVKIHDSFGIFSKEDLAVLSSYIVAEHGAPLSGRSMSKVDCALPGVFAPPTMLAISAQAGGFRVRMAGP